MGLAYADLDQRTRACMIEEIDRDVGDGSIYISRYLNAQGCESWPRLLRDAASSGSDDTLAAAIRRDRCLNSHYDKVSSKGRPFQSAVPHTAPETLGEGEFNRYYARGLCRRAIDEGIVRLEIYRAKAVAEPRPESQARIGMMVDPVLVLEDLRRAQGVEPALGVPSGPNSGMSLRIPR